MGRAVTAVHDWLFEPVALARVAWLRRILAAFVLVDVFLLTRTVASHGAVPAALYRPLLVPRALHLPVPTQTNVAVLQVVMVVAAVVVAVGRSPRLAGTLLAAGYTLWMFLAFGYGKIDHDRLPLIVALWVLSTVGKVGLDDQRRSEAAGWAVRCIQMAVVATYFLSAYAKIRHGGWGWANGETLTWALSRRGTVLGTWLIDLPPVFLHIVQWTVLLVELASPLIFVVGPRVRRWALWVAFGFHVTTYALLTIHFLPHVVCLLSFVPLEGIRPALRERGAARGARLRPASAPSPGASLGPGGS